MEQNDTKTGVSPETYEPLQQADIEALVGRIMRRLAARKRRRIVISALSATLSAAAVILFAVFLYPGISSPIPGVRGSRLNTMEVPAGATATLHLPDGSLAMLNSGTKVIYPSAFDKTERNIFVDGEVWLEVVPDKERPFTVSADGFDVRVHGTKFNVNTRSGSESVVLAEGAVEVSSKGGSGVMLAPGQMASMDDGLISVSEVLTEDYTSWTKGYINLHGEPVCRVAARLSEYYGIPISCDSGLLLYGKLELKSSLGKVLDNIAKVIDVDITYSESEGYTISSGR